MQLGAKLTPLGCLGGFGPLFVTRVMVETSLGSVMIVIGKDTALHLVSAQ